MYERFTERARQVVVLAQDEASKHHHAFIRIPHVLMGLVREEEGLAAKVLAAQGFTAASISYIGQPTMVVPKGEREGYQASTSAQVKHAYELALREALSLGHNYIGTEHILLGVLRATEGESYGLDHEKVRQAVLEALYGSRKRAKPKPEPEPEPEVVLSELLHDLVSVGVEFLGLVKAVVEVIR